MYKVNLNINNFVIFLNKYKKILQFLQNYNQTSQSKNNAIIEMIKLK